VGIYRQLIKGRQTRTCNVTPLSELRQRISASRTWANEDLYAPLASEVDSTLFSGGCGDDEPWPQVAPLGPEYGKKLAHGLRAGWTDFLPSTGKRAGAYSTGVYGVHPYQLLHFNRPVGRRFPPSPMRLGIRCTPCWRRDQPFATSSYAIFVAEIASTLNETCPGPSGAQRGSQQHERLALLGQRLESLRHDSVRKPCSPV